MIYEGQAIQCSLLNDQSTKNLNIANVCFNNQNESINKFDAITLKELQETIQVLNGKNDIDAAIVTSSKNAFIVGADITEFLGLFALPRNELLSWITQANAIFNGFEDLPFPTIAAIQGFCLGGGMEMVLSCDYRLCSTDASVGLPETKLGLIPGFGGTTRLPRLIGTDNAIEWIATAKPQKTEAALKVGAIDAIVEQDTLATAAIQMAVDAASNKLDWKNKRAEKQAPLKLNQLESAMAFNTAKAMVGAKAGPHYPAPLEAIRTIEESAQLSRDAALKIEHEAFVNVAQSPQASSLVQIFLNDQLIKKKAKQSGKMSNKQIHLSGVLGAGIMGGGIAYQSAIKGIPIIMKDINEDALQLGLTEATNILQKGIQLGKTSTAKMAKTLNNIRPTLGYDAFNDVDLVVEAIVENPKIKDAVLQEVESVIADDAILTSNTSTISIDLLAKNLKRPQQFCGMHFFNPVHKMPLVEIIRGEKTSEATIATVVHYAAAIGKSPIVVNDCPGFFVNRVLFPYFRGFSQLLQEGADFRTIDKVMTDFGWPMGPAHLLDVVGIDTATHCTHVMQEGFPERMTQLDNDPITQLANEQRFGQKNKQGFYQYVKDRKGKIQKQNDDSVFDIIGATKDTFDKETIIERLMLPMIFEVIHCLDENIIASPAEADMGLVYGLGFPPFRGGALKYADDLGLDTLCQSAQKYQSLGAAYEPPKRLQTMVEENTSFYSVQSAK